MEVLGIVDSAVVVSVDWIVDVAVLSPWLAPHVAIALDEIKTPITAKINALSIVMSFAISIHAENQVRPNSTQK